MKVKDVIAVLQNFDPEKFIGNIYIRHSPSGSYKEFELKFLASAGPSVVEKE